MEALTANCESKPAFAVVVPLYNKALFIRRTLQTVLAQSYAPAEVIIVDDSSTDGGSDRISDLLDDRVRLVRQTNSGPGLARNRGVAESSALWIAFIDGDDLWFSNHLETLAAVIMSFPQANVVGSAFKSCSVEESSFAKLTPDLSAQPMSLINYLRIGATRSLIWTSTAAVQRVAFENSGGFGSVWPGEDTDLWVRLALKNQFAISRKLTALYSVGTGGAMDTLMAMRRAGACLPTGPVFDTLMDLMTVSEDHRIRADALVYRDALYRRNARQALYSGQQAFARALLRLHSPGWQSEKAFLNALAITPRHLLAIGLNGQRMLKRLYAAKRSMA